jgi:outer membrane cobalamin receptor
VDRVIVTATRTPEEESLIGSAFSQLTGQQVETEQFIDLKNALNTTPGAFALEGGARGGMTTPQSSRQYRQLQPDPGRQGRKGWGFGG